MRTIGVTLAVTAAFAFSILPSSAASPVSGEDTGWTLVVLPDTQHYSEDYPDIFTTQTQWIAENVQSRSISFVVHEGDITNSHSDREWENARRSLSLLDGVVPYALVTGNHDYYRCEPRLLDSSLSRYFPVNNYRSLPTFGGVYERNKLDNSYHLFSAGGRDWLVLALEFGPRNGVLRWADRVLKKYPQRSAIIVTHAYLYSDDTRYDHSSRTDQHWNPHIYMKPPSVDANDGEEMWRKLVSPNPNVAFVLCGHVLNDGAGRLTSIGASGNTVHQILVNFQMVKEGGSGYLRLMEFSVDGKSVRFRTYSPHLKSYLTGDEHEFSLPLPPPPVGASATQ